MKTFTYRPGIMSGNTLAHIEVIKQAAATRSHQEQKRKALSKEFARQRTAAAL